MNRGSEINPDFRSWFHTSHTALELRSGYPLFSYICNPSLFEKVESLSSIRRSVIDLQIFSRPLPLTPICILDNADSTTFFKIKIALPISMPDKLVRTFPTCTECSSLAWLLHLHHRDPNHQAFKQVLAWSVCISIPVFLLRLLNIEQNILMYACDEPNLFQELYSCVLHIGGVINHVS